MTGTQFERVLGNTASIAMVVAGGLALVVALSLGKVILAPLSLAIVVGLMFGPVADLIERRGIPAAISAGLVVLLLMGVLAVGALLFAAPLSEWVARGPLLWERLRTQLAGLKEPLESLTAVQDQLKALMGGDATIAVEVQDGGPVKDAALMAPAILADVLLFLAGLYFFVATRHQLRISMLSLCFSRRMRWRTAHVFRDVEQQVSRFLLSAAAINLGVGVTTSLVLWALGFPSPLLWGALAAVLNFIPYVGQAIMLAILVAVGLGTQTDLIAIVLPAIAYGLINLTFDQIVFPHLVGKALTLNPFLIFVSIAFWIFVWGPIGGFIAVPSLLIVQSLVMHIFPTARNLQEAVRRKMEQRAHTEAKEIEAAVSEVPEKPAPKAAPARKRASRSSTASAAP
jgi:predicted PurR-regulated permease PerM